MISGKEYGMDNLHLLTITKTEEPRIYIDCPDILPFNQWKSENVPDEDGRSDEEIEDLYYEYTEDHRQKYTARVSANDAADRIEYEGQIPIIRYDAGMDNADAWDYDDYDDAWFDLQNTAFNEICRRLYGTEDFQPIPSIFIAENTGEEEPDVTVASFSPDDMKKLADIVKKNGLVSEAKTEQYYIYNTGSKFEGRGISINTVVFHTSDVNNREKLVNKLRNVLSHHLSDIIRNSIIHDVRNLTSLIAEYLHDTGELEDLLCRCAAGNCFDPAFVSKRYLTNKIYAAFVAKDINRIERIPEKERKCPEVIHTLIDNVSRKNLSYIMHIFDKYLPDVKITDEMYAGIFLNSGIDQETLIRINIPNPPDDYDRVFTIMDHMRAYKLISKMMESPNQ